MKRKMEDECDGEGPPPKVMFAPPVHYVPVGWPNMRGQGNMRGGFRIARGGPWRGPRMPNQHPRGYFRGGGGGRGGGRGWPMRNNHYDMAVPVVPYQVPHWQQPPPFHHELPPQQQYVGEKTETPEVDSSTGSNTNTNNIKVVVDEVGKGKNNKRRPMSQSYPSRPWNKEDAERALTVETTFMKVLRNQSLIIRFPDPELSKDLVKTFHPGITNVHFQVPSGPRYCFVQLSEKINTEKTIKELEQIKFGNGKLVVEKKFTKEEDNLSPEAIDPYTLYIGNLPTNVNVASVKEKFPTAARIDIGYAQRMKFTRYAFIRYNTVDEAIDAYKSTHNLVLDSRSIIVRFRRQRGPVGLPGEVKQPKNSKGSDKSKGKGKKEKEKAIKPKEEKVEEEAPGEDEEENEDADDDDDDDDEEEEDDDDDDDDDDDEEDDEDDDEEEEGEEEGVGVAADDDPDDDDDDDDDDDEDEEDDDLSRNLFHQIDTQIADIDGSSFNNL